MNLRALIYAFGLMLLILSRDGKRDWRAWWLTRYPSIVAEMDR